ncbi:NADH-ubiquinone oxidoreductase chain 4 [Gryllus bimaculatus]|nr:NADH-ubiquinone oxidoreductase chain 4 [Gryllus bimaculatus]
MVQFIFFDSFLLMLYVNLSGNIEGLSYILRYDSLSYDRLFPTFFFYLGMQLPARMCSGWHLFILYVIGFFTSINWFMKLMVLYIFMDFGVMKLIIFIFIWAHVEAPISVFKVLAGGLLKLGGYGLMRLVCLCQVDLKSLIAYSSVDRMGMVLGGLMTLNS